MLGDRGLLFAWQKVLSYWCNCQQLGFTHGVHYLAILQAVKDRYLIQWEGQQMTPYDHHTLGYQLLLGQHDVHRTEDGLAKYVGAHRAGALIVWPM
ncbi:hypothetical protein D3C80_1626480 [compost metagenome]